MTYRVDDDDDNSSSRDADTIEFTITIQPHTILENVVSAVAVGAGAGRLVYDSVPDPSGGPAISISGSGTIVTGGSFFLDVVAEAGAPIDTLLVSVEKEAAGYYEMELPGNASSYRLVGAVPYDLDQTRAASSVGLCVTAVHAIDRVGETQCHRVYIADIARVLTQDVQVTLSWDGDSNLDLQVVDPNGNEVGRSSVQGEQTNGQGFERRLRTHRRNTRRHSQRAGRMDRGKRARWRVYRERELPGELRSLRDQLRGQAKQRGRDRHLLRHPHGHGQLLHEIRHHLDGNGRHDAVRARRQDPGIRRRRRGVHSQSQRRDSRRRHLYACAWGRPGPTST